MALSHSCCSVPTVSTLQGTLLLYVESLHRHPLELKFCFIFQAIWRDRLRVGHKIYPAAQTRNNESKLQLPRFHFNTRKNSALPTQAILGQNLPAFLGAHLLPGACWAGPPGWTRPPHLGQWAKASSRKGSTAAASLQYSVNLMTASIL